jgi:hypothetical protein
MTVGFAEFVVVVAMSVPRDVPAIGLAGVDSVCE